MTHRVDGEDFHSFVGRFGKKAWRVALEELMPIPTYQEAAEFYCDWGDTREFTLGDMGKGECAGEVVSAGEFELAAAERLVFEAQVQLEERDWRRADQRAYRGMLEAVTGLLKTDGVAAPSDRDGIVCEFRRRFHDTGIFHDRFAGAKFADYLFSRHSEPPSRLGPDRARQLVEEAQLFIEASHACRDQLLSRAAATAPEGGTQ